MMGVSFYTTRVVLQALGVVDYGLVNAIGGVVAMFSFISISFSTACSRYFSFEIGRNDGCRLGQIFSMVVILYIGVAIVLLLCSESIGLWYVENKLIFPAEKTNVVRWFYQCTVLTVLIGWLAGPYSALIVSYENMGLYAWLSILDAGLKLSVAIGVRYFPGSSPLLRYGILLLLAAFIQTILHYTIVRLRYSVCKFEFYLEKRRFKEICSFGGWNLVGTFSWASSEIFINLLLNAFFGPIVNAARAVSAQVSSGVSSFTQNFLTAARPQIVKSWAGGNKNEFWELFKRISKISYMLLFVFTVPLMFELETVLSTWLTNVPQYTIDFTRIVLLTGIINSFSFPITYAAQAVGKLALFEGLGSGVRLLVFPCSYVALYCRAPASSVFWIALSFTFICVIVRFLILMRLTKCPSMDFCVNVFLRIVIASLLVTAFVWAIHISFSPGWVRVIASLTISVLASVCVLYWIISEPVDRMAFKKFILSKVVKRRE